MIGRPLRCRICNERLSLHKVIDDPVDGNLPMLECPTGDRKYFAWEFLKQ
jgi:hypothetical protein